MSSEPTSSSIVRDSNRLPEGESGDKERTAALNEATHAWNEISYDATQSSPQKTHAALQSKRPFEIGDVIANRYEVMASLGQGGFGAVYRAHDRSLNRMVAIKQSSGLRSFIAGQIRNEAKAVASLNHPNIVAIHDLITVTQHELLIIMECLSGTTLGKRMRQSRMPIAEAVEIAIQVADALQHAHEKLIVHSDLKPSNLFVCDSGTVKLLDFGLAVAYFPQDALSKVGGTPGYMSPEQIRGESHRIDGRADIWAFGVVIYEMLTGTRPFTGTSSRAISEATLRKEVPPPRQLNPEIDEELQRITLKCLEKRMIDRYDSAWALRDDLKHWLMTQANPSGEQRLTSKSTTAGLKTPDALHSSTSIGLRRRGLQPFTEIDAESYLPLVPGPRDRNGIPDSIRFWHRWVESNDPTTEYPVGVLYGPSGSGKTSYVRAGLLSSLGSSICSVYLECRPGNLGERLTRIVQSRVDEPSSSTSLRDILTRLRSGDSHTRGFRKLFIVLDQFEAWSHTATLAERQEFADALRQCDGVQIRALVVTRDDFWMGVKELLGWLELPLQEGRNVASVDLLDPPHAIRILEMLGRESGTLPPHEEPLSLGQQQFLAQAVEELTTSGHVICVHLVMFAQMVHLQRWTPKGLRSGGGVVGACSLFFHELFQKSGNHSPEYRRVAPIVPAILSELLPPTDGTVTEICITREQLQAAVASGPAPHLLDDGLRVLIDDLKIITVVNDEASSASGADGSAAPLQPTRYRLTHDFLVQPIIHWLDRVRSRTWRGRCKARLSALSDAWSRRQVKAQLPGFLDFLTLVFGSQFQHRTETEARFLKAATRLHAGRISLAIVAILAFVVMSILAWQQRGLATQARERELAANVDLLFNGPAAELTKRMTVLRPFGAEATDQIANWSNSVDPQLRLRAQLYLQTQAPRSIAGIAPLIEQAPPEFFASILNIAKESDDSKAELTKIIESSSSIGGIARAAILLTYLGELSPMQELLSGSDDANRDQGMLLAAASWRSSPEPWVGFLSDQYSPQVRYHASVILGTYKRDELEAAQVKIDCAKLINDPAPEVHSAGRYLAHHLGQDVSNVVLAPTAQAQWRLGPDKMPMVPFKAGVYKFEVLRNTTQVIAENQIDKDFWFSTVPVSRKLFAEFVASGTPVPDGSKLEDVSVERFDMPEELKKDTSQPVLKTTPGQAYVFCNWLSEREGLRPCYRHKVIPPKPMLINDFVPPEIPWELIESGDGYRVPTDKQYSVALHGGYAKGKCWAHAKTIATLGGDYVKPKSSAYTLPLFALIPNRRGLFVNDEMCGSWICGNPMVTGMQPFESGLGSNLSRERPAFDLSIYLVQQEPTTDVPTVARDDSKVDVVKKNNGEE